MKHFVVEAHVADVRLKVVGTTLEELFTAALEGMASIIAPDSANKTVTIQEEIEINSIDSTILLVDFLSDALALTHTQKAVFYAVKFQEISETALKATISGTHVNSFAEDIKAATYHEANVHKNKDGNLETTIVFDI